MTEVIIERGYEVKDTAKLGEIRADSDGRVIMVIEVENFRPRGENTKTLKTLLLSEGRNGCGVVFKTTPLDYSTAEKLAKMYPKVLTGSITIKGDV